VEVLCRITDPYLDWFRRFSSLRIGALDLSPLAAMAVLSVLNSVFLTLGRYGVITLGLILALILQALWSAASFILSFFIIGHPIPAGTGMKRYRGVKLFDEDSQDLDLYMQEILEKRRLERENEPEEEEFVAEEVDES
jgi:hypothetical protein